MARRKKSSPLEDVLDLLAMLPWWVCLVLAAVSYFLLHRLAVPIPASDIQGQGGDMVGAVIQKALIHGLANAGQYIVPLLCIAAAALSAWRRKQRQALVSDVAQARNADALDGMSWREFELLVGEAYRLQGYRVAEIGGGGPDGGVDLVLAKGAEKFFVQCKQWKAYKVGVTTVRELYGRMVWDSVIPIDTKFRDASHLHVPPSIYAPESRGSHAYLELLNYLLQEEARS